MPTATPDAAGRPADPVQTPPGGPARWRVNGVVLATGLIAICVVIGLSAALAPRTETGFGIPDPGQLVTLGRPVLKTIFDLAGAATIGWLLAAVVLAPPQRSGVFDVSGYRSIRAASLSAWVWAASALALVPFTISESSGYRLNRILGADALTNGLEVYEAAKNALIVAVIAALVATLCRVSLKPISAAALLVLALIGLVPMALAGHTSQSSDHDLATDTMLYHLFGVSVWVGGLLAFLGLARQRANHLDVIARRYSTMALIAFCLVAISGLGNALVRFTYFQDLWQTQYGLLILLKTALLVVLGVFGYFQRKTAVAAIVASGNRRPLLRLAVLELGVMGVAIGLGVVLGRTASPPAAPIGQSELELVLGYPLEGPGSFWQILTEWRFNLIFGIAGILAAGLYLLAVRRLRQRGDSWPPGRTVAWLAGCLLLVFATSSGMASYGETQFSIHMLGHMFLGMMAPILLVLGGPTTLALRALPVGSKDVPGPREAIVGLMHSRVLSWLTNPLVIFPLFVGSFFVIYLTPLFDVMVESHIGHLLMNLHFLLVGYLFYWVIIGVDPAPRRLSPMIKLAMLLGSLPFHAFFGLSLMNSRTVLGENYYRLVDAPWVTDLVSDQRTGGAIAWGGTEIPLIIVVIALLAQWSRSDAREADRADRKADRAAGTGAFAAPEPDTADHDHPRDDEPTGGWPSSRDDELDAYNAMLSQMAERDKRTPR